MAPFESAYVQPPEPQLLDTCTIQNLNWVDRTLAEAGGAVQWNKPRLDCLAERYGRKQAEDLIDLGTLYVEFECRGAYPWLVSRVSVEECGVLHGEKGDEIRGMLRHLAGHQEDLAPSSYPSVAVGLPMSPWPRHAPHLLRALGIETAEEFASETGPLGFLRDRGDRLLVVDAVLANIPAILTLDRRSLWCHRERLAPYGLQVLRPTELLSLYGPLWAAELAQVQPSPNSRKAEPT